jgi:protein TonB
VQVQPPPQQNVIQAVTRAPPPAQEYKPTVVAPPRPAVADHDVSERPIAGAPLQYPPEMEEEQREGSARISCDVDPNGTTSNCRVDSVSGGQAFAQAALAYVKRARYSPRTHNGVPVAASHQWNIKFKLGD